MVCSFGNSTTARATESIDDREAGVVVRGDCWVLTKFQASTCLLASLLAGLALDCLRSSFPMDNHVVAVAWLIVAYVSESNFKSILRHSDRLLLLLVLLLLHLTR